MKSFNQLKQWYGQQIENANWLQYALPLIAVLLAIYILNSLASAADTMRTELARDEKLLSQLKNISTDVDWVDRNQTSAAVLEKAQSSLKKMTNKTLLQAELLTSLQSLASSSNIGNVDIVVGEPVTVEGSDKYVKLDVNMRFRQTNGFAFEEFWHRLLLENPSISVGMLEVNHVRNMIQGRMNATIMVMGVEGL